MMMETEPYRSNRANAHAWKAAAMSREAERKAANRKIHWLWVWVLSLATILGGHVMALYAINPKVGWFQTVLSLAIAIVAIVVGAWKAPTSPRSGS